jgi:hypothetical protein
MSQAPGPLRDSRVHISGGFWVYLYTPPLPEIMFADGVED